MIELLRYARLKAHPNKLVSAKADPDGTVTVFFKRFSVEHGEELEPETSIVTKNELRDRLAEIEKELSVVRELLAL